MRLPIIIPLCLATLPLGAQEASDPDQDLLRFSNGDALHGSFAGMREGPVIMWTGSTIAKPMELQSSKLRRIAFNGGRARKSLESPSFLLLPNGDRVPGSITGIDRDSVSINTAIAGPITIPRENIVAVVPNPHGGTVHYMGPFSPDGWETVQKDDKEDDEESASPAEAAREDQKDGKDTGEEPWVFAGGAWYSNGSLPIAIDADIPDKARIAFHLAWRSRLSAVVSFHSTLKVPDPPEAKEGEEAKAAVQRVVRGSSSSGYPLTYGHSYVLTMYSSYAMLYRCDFNEDGRPVTRRLSSPSANLRLDDSGEAEFELRCDRGNNSIALFVNGRFVSQWEDLDGYAGIGGNLTFACHNSSSRLRVSDVVVSSWNGMLDSARSMDSQLSDVVLLTNGTDRFSGDLVSVTDDKVLLRGSYAELQIPIEDVQEIRFARDKVTELPDASDQAVRLLLHPVGRLTVDPVSASPTNMKCRSAALGEINVDLNYAGILEFAFGDSILDNWDDDF